MSKAKVRGTLTFLPESGWAEVASTSGTARLLWFTPEVLLSMVPLRGALVEAKVDDSEKATLVIPVGNQVMTAQRLLSVKAIKKEEPTQETGEYLKRLAQSPRVAPTCWRASCSEPCMIPHGVCEEHYHASRKAKK